MEVDGMEVNQGKQFTLQFYFGGYFSENFKPILKNVKDLPPDILEYD